VFLASEPPVVRFAVVSTSKTYPLYSDLLAQALASVFDDFDGLSFWPGCCIKVVTVRGVYFAHSLSPSWPTKPAVRRWIVEAMSKVYPIS
jgi:hypothetical protein